MRKIWILLCLAMVQLITASSCRHGASAEALAASEVPQMSEEELAAAEAADLERRQIASDGKLMNELKESTVVPDNYGHTLVISPDLPKIEAEPGPMEQLVDQPVTMRLIDADLQTIVMTLSQIEGLNIIADSALSEDQTLTIDVKEVPLREILGYIARNMGVAFNVGANTIWVTEAAEDDNGAQLETRIFRVRSGDLGIGHSLPDGSLGGGNRGGFGGGGGSLPEDDSEPELISALTEMISNGTGNSVLKLYPERNLLLVRDTRENIRLVEELLKEFDKPPEQVIIEARFLSVGAEDVQELGTEFSNLSMQWGQRNLNITGTAPDFDVAVSRDGSLKASSDFSNAIFPTEGLSATISGILGNVEYEMILHALARKGNTRVLSAPRVTLVNNQMARIRRGERLWYFEEYDVASTGSGDNERDRLVPIGSPAELELGITLAVTVNVAKDGKIMMNLRPEISDFLGWEYFDTGQASTNNNNDPDDPDDPSDTVTGGAVKLPRTREASVETTVIVQSGQTVVLGGTQISREEASEQKIPLLGDIPLIGALFRYRSKQDEPQHLIIFVTAKLVRPTGEFVEYEMPPVITP